MRLLCGLIASTLLLLSQSAQANDAVVVVTRDGKPATDATIVSVVVKESAAGVEFLESKPIPVDQTGRATFSPQRLGRYFYAKDAAGNVGAVKDYYIRVGKTDEREPIPILLESPTTMTRRFVDGAGKPIVGMSVKCLGVFTRPKDPYLIGIPPSLNAGVVSDSEGKFTLRGLPARSDVMLNYRSEQYGSLVLCSLASDPTDIAVSVPGAVKVILVDEDGKPLGFQAKLATELFHLNREIRVSRAFDSLNDPDAEGIIRGLPPGQVRLRTIGPIPRRKADDFPVVAIESGKTTEVIVKTKLAVQLSGMVADAATGKGLPDVRIFFRGETATDIFSAYTDADGRYFATFNGGSTYRFNIDSFGIQSQEKHYLQPEDSGKPNAALTTSKLMPGDTHEFPTIKLTEGLILKGKIVSLDTKPLTGKTKIICPLDFGFGRDLVKIDGDTFTHYGLPRGVPIKLFARNGNAVNIPERIDPKQFGEFETLKLSESHAVTFVGRIEDQSNRGVAGVKVQAMWSATIVGPNSRASSTITTDKSTTTDADGNFTFTGMWPNELYSFTSTDEQIGNVGTNMNQTIQGKPGETVKVATFRAKRSDAIAKVVGKVVHLDGTPVAGAIVRTSGETPKPIEVTTDADGVYTINGLPTTKLFLTVTKPGYRHTYNLFEPKSNGPTLTLRRETDPPAPMPEISQALLDARKKATADILDLLWQNRQTHGYGTNFFGNAARFDYAIAERWFKAMPMTEAACYKPSLKKPIADADLIALAIESPDEAMEFVVRGSPSPSASLLQLAEKLIPHDKAKALIVVEESVRRARKDYAKSIGFLISNLAGSASRAARAGNVAGGRTLIVEAIKLIDSLPEDSRNSTMAYVATQLAEFDVNEGIALLGKVTESSYHNRELATILAQQAKTNPDEAIKTSASSNRIGMAQAKRYDYRSHFKSSIEMPTKRSALWNRPN